MRMRITIINMIFFILTSCGSNNIKKSNYQNGVKCIFNNKIAIIDDKIKLNTEGLFVAIFEFNTSDSLSIKSFEIRQIYLKVNNKKLASTDIEFIFIKNKLTPILDKIKCEMCKTCDDKIYNNRILFNVPFTINKPDHYDSNK